MRRKENDFVPVNSDADCTKSTNKDVRRDMVLEKGYEIVFGMYRLLSVQDTLK